MQPRLLALSAVLFVAFVVALDRHWLLAGLGVVFGAFLVLRPRVLLGIDWALLAIIALMFVDLRLIADLEAAQFITANNASDAPVFLGDAKSVTLVRIASAPGAAQRLEFVRFTETIDERGFAMVRSHAPFRPLAEGRSLESQIYFMDPVVLVRAPVRVSFEVAGPDRLWRSSRQNEALLPSVARIDVRDARTGDLAFSTAALLHVDFPGQAGRPSRSTTLGQ